MNVYSQLTGQDCPIEPDLFIIYLDQVFFVYSVCLALYTPGMYTGFFHGGGGGAVRPIC